ncbi:MAG: hypothetical protein ISS67_06320 [Desulfobacterales bacterium]|uniref:Lipoprotein n=1 Tax=Candidatus Desulfaltia bathyphila TaxID=2841697 RepID=A0A8J6N8H2_9BACT|nr:hypothetical protein [Candidatus Desulfaltia bathyphila]MBL7195598.1 hypothetical protein [Desulfobacterales bacterium]MBL7208118.1 hypothetical protein [Desulfobacterales bacterium]
MVRKKMSKLIIFIFIVFLIMGCSIKNIIVEDITLRENQQYTPIMDRDSQERLLSKIFDLLKRNENMDIELFKSDPKNRTPKKKG